MLQPHYLRLGCGFCLAGLVPFGFQVGFLGCPGLHFSVQLRSEVFKFGFSIASLAFTFSRGLICLLSVVSCQLSLALSIFSLRL